MDTIRSGKDRFAVVSDYFGEEDNYATTDN
jgi:hypothetical protein